MIETGFYNLSELNSIQLKKLFKDCCDKATHIRQDILRESKWTRETWEETPYTNEEFINKFCSESTHNVFIDRKVQYDFGNIEYEAGFSTFGSPALFLFIFIDREKGDELIKKHKLKL